MADFTIAAPEPFIVETPDGEEYELPRLKDLSSEQLGLLSKAPKEFDVEATAAFAEEFCIALCPELGKYGISPMVYMDLFKALAEGSGIELGES